MEHHMSQSNDSRREAPSTNGKHLWIVVLTVGIIAFVVVLIGSGYLGNSVLQLAVRIIAGVPIVAGLILLGYHAEWTGFEKSVDVKNDEKEELRPRKTLW